MRALGLSPPSLFHLKVMPDEVGTGEGLPATSRARTERLAARQRMQRRPPPSMWTAPQSQIPPPNPADAPSPERAATYFRRVSAANMVNGPMPTRGQRIANVAGGVLGVTLGLYMVLLHDFGTHEHVFMPVRRFFSLDALNPFALTSAEKKWAHQKGIGKARTSDGEEKIV